jgi:hypothetical protein
VRGISTCRDSLSLAVRGWRVGLLARFVLVGILSLSCADITVAQDDLFEIELKRELDVGLEGAVRAGTWAPLRLQVVNKTGGLRYAAVEWLVFDVDGDVVISRRDRVALKPKERTSVVLYAVPPVGGKTTEGWRVRVVEQKQDDDGSFVDGEVLASRLVAPMRVIKARESVIGVTRGGTLGLSQFSVPYTHHEGLEIVAGIFPANLPDRWHGLSLLETLVWTPQGGDPTAAGVPFDALREWVKRGGHLVVTMSAADATWSDRSNKRLAELLPPVKIVGPTRIETPAWLIGDPVRATNRPMDVRTFEMAPRGDDKSKRDVVVLLKGTRFVLPVAGFKSVTQAKEVAVVVASPYGLGRVTLIGFDLTGPRFRSTIGDDANIRTLGLPHLWRKIMSWRSPVELPIGKLRKEEKIVNLIARDPVPMDDFIPGKIAMKKTAGVTLLVAVVLFAVYWLCAGPGLYAFLKSKGMLRHAWLGFACVVIVFSGVCWVGAIWLRPGQSQVEHFSIVDIDTSTDQVRTHSWFSLFVPKHGVIDVEIDKGYEGSNLNLLASPGLVGSEKGVFLDEQRYTVNVKSPGDVPGLPVRATAKQFEATYQDSIGASSLDQRWSGPSGSLAMKAGFPVGELKHDLPGRLENVTLVFCHGDGFKQVVVYKNQRRWARGDKFLVRPPTKSEWWELVKSPPKVGAKITDPKGYLKRTYNDEGYLGTLYGRRYERQSMVDDDQAPGVEKLSVPKSDELVDRLFLMSFYNHLPPPNFMEGDNETLNMMRTPKHLIRAAVRSLDLSYVTAFRRLIIIGHLENDSPIPLPLKVDGQIVGSSGWTTVRFILPIE